MRNTKLSRRSFLAALGLGTAAALLSGCAGPDSASSSGGEGPASSSSGEAEAEPFLSPEEFPGVDGSTACIPLIAQMMADTTGIPLSEAQSSVAVSTTAYAWENMGVYGSSEIELLVVWSTRPPTTSRRRSPPPASSWNRSRSAGTRWSLSSTRKTPSRA